MRLRILLLAATLFALALPARAGEADTLRAELAAKEKAIKELEAKIETLKAKKDEDALRDSRIVARLAALPKLEQRITELETEAKETEETLARERQRVTALSGKALDLERQLKEALARLADAEKAHTEKVAAFEKEVGALKARITELEAKLKEAGERIATLEALLGKEKELNAAQALRIAELEKQLAELQRTNGALQATVDATKDALRELERRKAEADARIAEFRALIAKFKSLIDSGKLRVKMVEGRMVVELATDILFASGSASLSRDGTAAIKEVAAILASIADRKFQIEGHTDNVPISTEQFPSNWELASARAITVVKTMVQAGLPAPRISAASYADVRPAMSNETKDGKKANRRIEIVLVPDLSSLPGFEELNKVADGG